MDLPKQFLDGVAANIKENCEEYDSEEAIVFR